MKYVVLIVDGAAGLPIKEKNGLTSLEAAKTPNLDIMAKQGMLGLGQTVPPGMEPGSAVACMSVIGYDPKIYYKGRASIEAASLGVTVGAGEAVFRCNLVNTAGGKMNDYSGGHITSEEAAEIVTTLNEKLGTDDVIFYPGVGFRQILMFKGHEDTLKAICTPPHDISGREIKDYLPRGTGAELIQDLMTRSETIMKNHKINLERARNGLVPITSIWLFWGSGKASAMPTFRKSYGLKATMTSAVDLLKGLAKMAAIDILNIKGVTDGSDNDHAAQAEGALKALDDHDLVVIHIEAPDESGHGGHIDQKIGDIEKIDKEVVSRLLKYKGDLRVLVMPDHPTPLSLRTHTPEPVPYLIWGKGIKPGAAARFTENEAKKTGISTADGYKIMETLLRK
jgi:2,3-bisphosphoglycerate-independent phosphoglycerate mutase